MLLERTQKNEVDAPIASINSWLIFFRLEVRTIPDSKCAFWITILLKNLTVSPLLHNSALYNASVVLAAKTNKQKIPNPHHDAPTTMLDSCYTITPQNTLLHK